MSQTQTLTAEQQLRPSSSYPPPAPANAPTGLSDDIEKRTLSARLAETVRCFWDLGFISFGGPGVHVVILRKRFVDKLKWLDETTFADLFALGNALPGPGSTQLAFSIAVVKNGTLAGLLAFLLWSLPAAVSIAGLAAGVRKFPEVLPPIVLALLTGLNASAVGLIALAAFQLSKTAVTDKLTRLLVLLSASFGICYHAPWMYPVLIAAGGLSTLAWDYRYLALRPLKNISRKRSSSRRKSPSSDETTVAATVSTVNDEESKPQISNFSSSSIRQRGTNATASSEIAAAATTQPALAQHAELMVLSKKVAVPLLLGTIVLIVSLVVVRAKIANPPRSFEFFVNMVIAGVIIFGGGPVVIPLLRGYTVTPGWVDDRDFLLGFAILQAFPGPNFNFAAYLGVLALPFNPALGAFLGWLGIFSPGILLKLSLLPLYNTWRKNQVAKSVLRGLNAAATGLVYTAVWQLFLVGYIYTPATGDSPPRTSASGPLTTDPFWGAVAASAFTASQWFGSPPPVTILGGALAGLAWFGVVGQSGTERIPL